MTDPDAVKLNRRKSTGLPTEDRIRKMYEVRLFQNLSRRAGRFEDVLDAADDAVDHTARTLGITDIDVMGCTSPPCDSGLLAATKGITLW